MDLATWRPVHPIWKSRRSPHDSATVRHLRQCLKIEIYWILFKNILNLLKSIQKDSKILNGVAMNASRRASNWGLLTVDTLSSTALKASFAGFRDLSEPLAKPLGLSFKAPVWSFDICMTFALHLHSHGHIGNIHPHSTDLGKFHWTCFEMLQDCTSSCMARAMFASEDKIRFSASCLRSLAPNNIKHPWQVHPSFDEDNTLHSP